MFLKSSKGGDEQLDTKVGSFEPKNHSSKKILIIAVIVLLAGVGLAIVTRGIRADAGWSTIYSDNGDTHATLLACRSTLDNKPIVRLKYTGNTSPVNALLTVFGPPYGYPYVQKVSPNVSGSTWSGFYNVPTGATVMYQALNIGTGLGNPTTVPSQRATKLADIVQCTTTTPPPPPPAACPTGQTGTPPNCVTPPPATCPTGKIGTPPNCTTPPPPSTGGFPNANNTGVPAGTVLHSVSNLNLSDGAVIDGADITSNFTVRANNVTIKNSRIRGNGYWLVKLAEGYKNLTIQDTEITRLNSCSSSTDVSCFADYGIMDDGDGLQVLRVNIHNVTSGIHFGDDSDSVTAGVHNGRNALIQDSYIWGLANISGADHNDDLLSNGNTHNLAIRHNTLEVPGTQTTPIALYDEARVGGGSNGVIVYNNLINGGGFCIYMGPTNLDIQVTNNHFGKKFYPKCGFYGVSHDSLPPTVDNVWSGNVWDDTGAAIPQP